VNYYTRNQSIFPIHGNEVIPFTLGFIKTFAGKHSSREGHRYFLYIGY